MKRPANYWELVKKYYPDYNTCNRIKLTVKLFTMIRDKKQITDDGDMFIFGKFTTSEYFAMLEITNENMSSYYDASCDYIYRVTLDSMLTKLAENMDNDKIDVFDIDYMLDNV